MLPATRPVTVLYSDWKLHVLMVVGVALVGAATEPYAVVLVHCALAVPMHPTAIAHNSAWILDVGRRAIFNLCSFTGSAWCCRCMLADPNA